MYCSRSVVVMYRTVSLFTALCRHISRCANLYRSTRRVPHLTAFKRHAPVFHLFRTVLPCTALYCNVLHCACTASFQRHCSEPSLGQLLYTPLSLSPPTGTFNFSSPLAHTLKDSPQVFIVHILTWRSDYIPSSPRATLSHFLCSLFHSLSQACAYRVRLSRPAVCAYAAGQEWCAR